MSATPTHCRIHYVSAPCGSGKTYATCQYIKEHRYIRNHMYVAPTMVLIEETAKELRKLWDQETQRIGITITPQWIR